MYLKKISKLVLSAFLIGLVFSCDFLDQPPVNSPTSANFYQNDSQLEKAIVAPYSALANRSFYGTFYTLVMPLMTVDAVTDETSLSWVYDYTYDALGGGMHHYINWWRDAYEGIYRANLVLEKAKVADDGNPSAAVVNQVKAEALVLRAIFHWHVGTLFGKGPVVLNTERVDYPATPKAEMYAQCIADVNAALGLNGLPEYGDHTKGRLHVAAAKAFLGKLQLYTAQWAAAATTFDEIITSGDFGLIDIADVWSVAAEGSDDDIFSLEYARVGGSAPWANDAVDASEGALRNVFIGPVTVGAWGNAAASPNLKDAYDANDLRWQEWVYETGDIAKEDGSTVIDETAAPYAVGDIAKGVGSAPYAWPDWGEGGYEENLPLIRYADLLLMAAEAHARNNNTATAENYLWQVRQNAFGGTPPEANVGAYVTAQGGLLAAIKHERRLELAFEGHRYNDLKRWHDLGEDDIVQELGPTAVWYTVGGNPVYRGWTVDKKYFPIPQVDIDRSGGVLQP